MLLTKTKYAQRNSVRRRTVPTAPLDLLPATQHT